jgi:hypothetical protein
MKTVYSPPIIAISFWFLVIAMFCFYEYGFIHKYIDSFPTCCICLEHVYKSKLMCGHYVHKTCLIKTNPKKYFNSSIP